MSMYGTAFAAPLRTCEQASVARGDHVWGRTSPVSHSPPIATKLAPSALSAAAYNGCAPSAAGADSLPAALMLSS